MKQIIIKALSYIVTLIIAVNIISAIVNKGSNDMTVEMSEATFPTMKVNAAGYDVNTLYGYNCDIKANYIRGSITPISDDRRVSVEINLWGNTIEGISYEVRSLDTKRLVESTEVTDYEEKNGSVFAEFKIKDLIDKKREYLLVTVLSLSNGTDVKYYTRIIQDEELPVKEQLKFVNDFHNKTFDKAAAKSITTYLESNEDGDNSTYNKVNIHSSFNQITWGNLKIEKVNNYTTTILEMDQDIASIRNDFEVDVKHGEKTERYLVVENFRTRYTQERIYLLSYERTMNELFQAEENAFSNDKIMLGITDLNHDLKENNDGSIIVFKQQNSLYEYRNQDGKLTKLFSFYDEDNDDIRTLHNEHDIKVLNIDEAGNVLFVILGYMNRGRHEGELGVSVQYYDIAMNTIQEQVYIPYDRSYELLANDLKKLSFVSRANILYLYIGDCIYSVKLDERTGQIQVQGLAPDQIVSSSNNMLVAWDDNNNSVIKLMNLNSGVVRDIEAGADEKLYVLGFLQEDIVYGVSKPSDIVRDSSGIERVLMHTVNIENKDGELQKTYAEDGIYVTNADITGSAVLMTRVRRDHETGTLFNTSNDQIMSTRSEPAMKNNIIEVITEDKEKVVEISLLADVAKSIHLQIPKEVLIEGGNSLKINNDSAVEKKYYVYYGGMVEGIFTRAVNAVKLAAEINGIVVDDSQNYIWKKGARQVRCRIQGISEAKIEEGQTGLSVCMDEILRFEDNPKNCAYELENGETALSLLSANINGSVLELTGCDLPSVLYYVSMGKPVLAQTPGGGSVLIIGYDEKNTILMDPIEGRIYKKGMNDSADWFMRGGNAFIAYVVNE